MSQQNITSVNKLKLFKFYESKKPLSIFLDTELLDKQIEDLIENDELNLKNLFSIRENIRNLKYNEPEIILNNFKEKNNSNEDDVKYNNLLYNAKFSGCLTEWSK